MKVLRLAQLLLVSGGNKPDNCKEKKNEKTGGKYYECEGVIFDTCHSIKKDGSVGNRIKCP
ncbi:hypothetical protein [Pseudoalteromonas sp. MTN2-4]|uniref:hypothetical protein n=1 Tax=Pseudoalteromonas sp. MTN2-4 TaxID=3056555 RepID=UPI0036F3C9A2